MQMLAEQLEMAELGSTGPSAAEVLEQVSNGQGVFQIQYL